MHQTTSCPPAPRLKRAASAGAHLEQELLGVDVVDQAGVVLVHHGQLAARRAHVQAAHGRGLLQQHDGQRVVHEDLQDLGPRETNSLTLLCAHNGKRHSP